MMDKEMKDLAERMAADEAHEGNYTAAAELQRFNQLAPTGPLTPGQVPCRVCQLDDRTRAASSPDDMLCNVCREDTPNREAKARRDQLAAALETFFQIEPNREIDNPTTGDVWELELRQERVQAMLRFAEMVEGHPVPENLLDKLKISLRQYDESQKLGPRSVGCFSPAEETSDGRPSTVPPFAEQVLWVRGEVIGWVWPVDASPDSDWRCVTNFAEVSGAGLFGREGTRQARDRAIGWVLEQAHTLREEADRG